MENKRPSHQITLVATDGHEVTATVCTPTIDRNTRVRKLSRKITMMNEEYAALFGGSTAINERIANARAANNAEELADAERDLAALDEQLERIDREQYQLMIERTKIIVNVSKGDAEVAPEIAWDQCDLDEMTEALNFFLTGKAR
jgi:hypothetical protein